MALPEPYLEPGRSIDETYRRPAAAYDPRRKSRYALPYHGHDHPRWRSEHRRGRIRRSLHPRTHRQTYHALQSGWLGQRGENRSLDQPTAKTSLQQTARHSHHLFHRPSSQLRHESGRAHDDPSLFRLARSARSRRHRRRSPGGAIRRYRAARIPRGRLARGSASHG